MSWPVSFWKRIKIVNNYQIRWGRWTTTIHTRTEKEPADWGRGQKEKEEGCQENPKRDLKISLKKSQSFFSIKSLDRKFITLISECKIHERRPGI